MYMSEKNIFQTLRSRAVGITWGTLWSGLSMRIPTVCKPLVNRKQDQVCPWSTVITSMYRHLNQDLDSHPKAKIRWYSTLETLNLNLSLIPKAFQFCMQAPGHWEVSAYVFGKQFENILIIFFSIIYLNNREASMFNSDYRCHMYKKNETK